MTDRVLILGGRGRIGSNVAADIATHTQAQITITGRSPEAQRSVSSSLGKKVDFLVLDLAEVDKLREAIRSLQFSYPLCWTISLPRC
jgi:saccharopine dehydrogenase-like NADP-dependent oxidoreductase